MLPIPVLGDIISAGGNLIGKIIDKIAPDKISEAEKLKITTEFQFQAIKLAQSQWDAELSDAINARALALREAETAPWIVRIFNGIIRPYGGFAALSVLFYTILYKHIGQWTGYDLAPLSLDNWQYGLLGSIIAFFFGLRQFAKSGGTQDKW